MGFFGMLFGKVDVETPAHVIVHQTDKYQIWRYPSQVAATVYAADLPRKSNGEMLVDNELTDKAFPILARYIGVFRDPENKKASPSSEQETDDSTGEKVAMTAPVIMSGEKSTDSNGGEKVAMTAPVIMSGASTDKEKEAAEGEKVAMTAPVIMSGATKDGEKGEKVAMTAPVVMGEDPTNRGQSMTFLLPAKYTSVEEAPVPTNAAVKLSMVEGGRCEAVMTFSGSFNMQYFGSKANELIKLLEKDDVKVIGKWTYQGYNPPFTLPWARRNEIHVAVDPKPYEDVEGTAKAE